MIEKTEPKERAVTGGKMRWLNVRYREQVDHLRIVWGDKCKSHEAGWCLPGGGRTQVKEHAMRCAEQLARVLAGY